MSNILTIKLNHNYKQFDGIFYYWLYLSFNKEYTPLFFCFDLPDGRQIKTMTEAIYLSTSDFEEKGINTLKGTKATQLLADAYSAPDLDLKTSTGWHEKLLSHAAQYYEQNLFSDNIPDNPLSKEKKTVKTLMSDGIIKLLLLRKVSDDVLNLYAQGEVI